MSKPIVVSKYFSSSFTSVTKIQEKVVEEEEEPISELSQHTDTEINEQLSIWTVDTQDYSQCQPSENSHLNTLFEEKVNTSLEASETSTTENELNQSNDIETEQEEEEQEDQLNKSEGEEEMVGESGEQEIQSNEEQEIMKRHVSLDFSQYRASYIKKEEKKEPLSSLDLNQFKAPIGTEKIGKLNPSRFKTPALNEPRKTIDLNQFKAPGLNEPREKIDLNQFKAPFDPKYKNRIPPKKPKARKQVPSFKYMKDTKFVVDAFSYGKITDCEGYFLSHFHTDHYAGLKSNWTHGPIYCSQITANLIKSQLLVQEQYIHPLPMDELVPVTENIRVGLIDANHCPGSVLFLFVNTETNSRHLHTGDFRASPKICLHPLVRQPENPPLDSVYLDTTYMDPKYAFPAQEECIQAVCDLIQKELTCSSRTITSFLVDWSANKRTKTMNQRVLIVIGAYKIGKERVFYNVAKMLDCKIYVTDDRRKILDCQENKDLIDRLTSNPLEAQVHVVQLNTIKGDNMREYLLNHKSAFDRIIAIKPTGWAYKSNHQPEKISSSTCLDDVIIPPTKRSLPLSPSYNWSNIKIFGVPYSEHSSFRELGSFIASIEMKEIIPTVKTPDDMVDLLKQWQKERVAKGIVSYSNENHW